MEIINQLQQLGFSHNKARVYFASLEVGSATAAVIAKQAGLQRTTTYKLLEEITAENLIERDIGGKVITYTARPPQALARALQEKYGLAMSVAGTLEGIIGNVTPQPQIRFYSGKAGAKRVFEDALTTTEKTIYTFSPIVDLITFFGKTYARHYLAKRKRLGIIRKALRQPSAMKVTEELWDLLASADQANRQVRFLPKNINFSSLIQLYDHKVSFISFGGAGYAFIIENKELADVLKGIFHFMWSHVEERHHSLAKRR